MRDNTMRHFAIGMPTKETLSRSAYGLQSFPASSQGPFQQSMLWHLQEQRALP